MSRLAPLQPHVQTPSTGGFHRLNKLVETFDLVIGPAQGCRLLGDIFSSSRKQRIQLADMLLELEELIISLPQVRACPVLGLFDDPLMGLETYQLAIELVKFLVKRIELASQSITLFVFGNAFCPQLVNGLGQRVSLVIRTRQGMLADDSRFHRQEVSSAPGAITEDVMVAASKMSILASRPGQMMERRLGGQANQEIPILEKRQILIELADSIEESTLDKQSVERNVVVKK